MSKMGHVLAVPEQAIVVFNGYMIYIMNRTVKRWVHFQKIKHFKNQNIQKKKNLERFGQFSTLKNDFENQNFEMFEEVAHNVGKSDGDTIQ